MFEKLNFGSALAALILFAFPWLDIQCSQKTLATQSGIQVIYGGGTPAEEPAETEVKKDDDNTIGKAPLIGLALIAVLGAVVASSLALFKGGEGPKLFSGVFPAIALTLLVVQMMNGFPLENEISEAMAETKSEDEGTNAFANSAAQMAMMNFAVNKRPALYLELVVLALPTLLLLNGFIDSKRKQVVPQDPAE